MKNWYLVALCCLPLAACTGGDIREGQPSDAVAVQSNESLPSGTLVYDCNGFEFVARLGVDEITVWVDDGEVVLPQVRSASGALYEAGDVSFWSKGDDAMLTLPGQSHMNCYLQRQRVPWEEARRRGVDFRATGNEPGWHLEIRSGRQLLLVTDYGMRRIVVLDPLEETVGETRVYHGTTRAHEVRVEIVETPCTDTMSGQIFPNQAVVTLDNTRFQGCGQDLDYPWEEFE